MKRKTATFVIYRPFGTSGAARALNIEYRRSCLWSFSGNSTDELILKATTYARTLGFTDTKVRMIAD